MKEFTGSRVASPSHECQISLTTSSRGSSAIEYLLFCIIFLGIQSFAHQDLCFLNMFLSLSAVNRRLFLSSTSRVVTTYYTLQPSWLLRSEVLEWGQRVIILEMCVPYLFGVFIERTLTGCMFILIYTE